MTRPNPQRALITGASRGLGLALATILRERGAQVVGIARDERRLHAALAPIGAHPLAADVGDTDADALVARASSLAGGPFDLFVHAASTLGPLGDDSEDPMPRLADVSADALQRTFAVNTLGPALLVRALHRTMRREGGTVVVISSDAAIERYPGWGPYGASKTALDHLVGVWAAEDAALRFLAFDPGEMDTAMHAAAMPTADRDALADPGTVAAAILARLDATSGTRAVIEAA
ncbi:MAG: SDR family NAD(P)-dependent oxidoreductase [Deltaproteobacteria bacterium]|nr:SDR family NAD(P)-dependent oxidoreductase [Deltaproteobacteria bacterium]